MAHHTRLRRRSALVATLTAALLLGGEAAAQHYPERPVTWLIAFGAGGGTDIFARRTGQLLNQEDISDATFIYENRPGGSGVRALLDLIHQQEGNDHMLFPFQDVVIVPALQGDIEENYESLTVIAGLALDRHFVVVPGDSPYQSLTDLVEASQDEQVVIGIGSSGRFPATLLAENSDLDARMVRFEGDAEIVAALLGGHVEAGFANPSEVFGQLEAGSLRAIGVAAPERLEQFPDVPTFREQGYDVVFGLFRGIGMPPGVPDEVAAYWTEKLRELSQTEAWQTEYIEKYALDGEFIEGDAFVDMMANELVPVYQRVLEQEK